MRHASKDLLYLERKNLASSSLESSLLVCNKNSTSKEPCRNENPITKSASKSQVLGRVKNFLEVISEANKKLQLDTKDNSEKYDIEVLDGNESEVIEMDLMLGIADLHTPEAVAAAESAIIGNQPVIPLTCSSSSSESESEESSDDSISSDNNNDDDDKSDDQNTDHSNRSSINLKRSKSKKTSRSSKNKGKGKSKKRPKILELS